jgi:hypothetical protein
VDEAEPAYGALRSPHFPIGFLSDRPINRLALSRALDDLVYRHDALRTSFTATDWYSDRDRGMQVTCFRRTALFIPGLYTQNVSTDARPAMREMHVDAVDDETVASVVEAEIDSATAGDAPHVIRSVLLQGPDTHLLIILMSHLVADGWSVHVFQRELLALYEAHLNGQPRPPLPRVAQYPQFAVAQHREVMSGALAADAAYWLRQWTNMAGASISHQDIPFARTVIFRPTFAIARARLCPADSARVVEIAGKLRTTPYLLVRTAVAIVLHHYTGKPRVAFWANFANRRTTRLGNMIGWCANTHPVTVAVESSIRCTNLCRTVANATLECQAHEAIPLPAVWRLSGRNLAIAGDTRINFDGWPVLQPSEVQGTLTPVVIPGGRRWMDFDLRLRHDGSAFSLIATYNKGRYAEGGVTDMLASVERVVSAMAVDESATVESCEVLVK